MPTKSEEVLTSYVREGFMPTEGSGGVAPLVKQLSNFTVVVSDVDGTPPESWSEPTFAGIYTRQGWFDGDWPVTEIGGYDAQAMLAIRPWIPVVAELENELEQRWRDKLRRR